MRKRLAHAGLRRATATPRREWMVDPLDVLPASAAKADGGSFGPAAGLHRCAEVSAPSCRTAQTASASCRGQRGAAPHQKSKAPTALRPRKRTAPTKRAQHGVKRLSTSAPGSTPEAQCNPLSHEAHTRMHRDKPPRCAPASSHPAPCAEIGSSSARPDI